MLAIDTDPGIDDAATLAVAARSPEIDLRLVTTVAGNVEVAQATANALALLHRLGRDDVPVAAGAARGLVRRKPQHPPMHGPNGLGGVILPAPERRAVAAPAADALGELLLREPAGTVTVVAIAPLTNLALLLATRPEAAARAARVVVMGGSNADGNVTPHAEYNTWADPEAAARVLAGGELDVWLVPLPVTRQATLDRPTAAALRAASGFGALLATMIDGYADAPRVAERALHDVVTVAALIAPETVAFRPGSVEVEVGAGERRGATEITFPPPTGTERPVQVAVDLDVERLRALLLARVAGV